MGEYAINKLFEFWLKVNLVSYFAKLAGQKEYYFSFFTALGITFCDKFTSERFWQKPDKRLRPGRLNFALTIVTLSHRDSVKVWLFFTLKFYSIFI